MKMLWWIYTAFDLVRQDWNGFKRDSLRGTYVFENIRKNILRQYEPIERMRN